MDARFRPTPLSEGAPFWADFDVAPVFGFALHGAANGRPGVHETRTHRRKLTHRQASKHVEMLIAAYCTCVGPAENLGSWPVVFFLVLAQAGCGKHGKTMRLFESTSPLFACRSGMDHYRCEPNQAGGRRMRTCQGAQNFGFASVEIKRRENDILKNIRKAKGVQEVGNLEQRMTLLKILQNEMGAVRLAEVLT